MFRVLAYMAPLGVGLGLAAAVSLSEGKSPRSRLLSILGVWGGALLILLVSSLSESLVAWLKIAVILTSFGAFVVGLSLLGESLRVPREVTQVVSGVLVIALVGSVFWMGPLIREAADTDPGGKATYRRITIAVAASPYLVMGYSVFAHDPLHSTDLYSLGLHDYPYEKPGWGGPSGVYAGVGVGLYLLSRGARALGKRGAG
jgi:hypothetical protein